MQGAQDGGWQTYDRACALLREWAEAAAPEPARSDPPATTTGPAPATPAPATPAPAHSEPAATPAPAHSEPPITPAPATSASSEPASGGNVFLQLAIAGYLAQQSLERQRAVLAELVQEPHSSRLSIFEFHLLREACRLGPSAL